jgi:hypothetical protein
VGSSARKNGEFARPQYLGVVQFYNDLLAR